MEMSETLAKDPNSDTPPTPNAHPAFNDIRKRVLATLGIIIVTIFGVSFRYPHLLSHAAQLDATLASFIYLSEVIPTDEHAPIVLQILYGSINWLWSMKVGMTFGLLLGALLHTLLQIYPLRFGNNTLFNQIKGIMLGAPSGVCVNCAVPIACGAFRTNSVPLETMFSFMLSAPTLNIVVVFMVFSSLPWFVAGLHYCLISLTLFIVIPAILRANQPLRATSSSVPTPAKNYPTNGFPLNRVDSLTSSLPNTPQQVKEVLLSYGKHLKILSKATIPFMVMASVLSAAAVQWFPFDMLLAEVTVPRLALIAIISTLLPVPIALDIMVATHLNLNGIHLAYSFLFLSTLGTYSILPMLFLWREVSKPIAFQLFVAFSGLAFLTACIIDYCI
jgi:uncharacterized membrane protein YraQ (UPF0718 family)